MPESILTVTSLTRRIRNALELEFTEIWVQGEVSNHRLQSSGHQYFTLKDSGAQLSCVLFKGQARHSHTRITDGMKIQVFGDISVYEPRGSYQLIARQIQAVGHGELQAKFDALKAKLGAEGLFDPARKRPIPSFPKVVGVVTSPTGAAVRDLLHVLSRRAPWVHVLIFPARVQGSTAYRDIVHAIELANRAPSLGLPKIDTLIVTRGGGSLEDLWSFNEEAVARAISASKIPVISAVGHEIDFTISDFAADLRAPTPSAAAEVVAPDGSELLARISRLASTLGSITLRSLEHRAHILELHTRGVLRRGPSRAIDEGEQALDFVVQSLRSRAISRLADHGHRLDQLASSILRIHPEFQLDAAQSRLQNASARLAAASKSSLKFRSERLSSSSALLRSLGPHSAFARGFSMTTDAHGTIITSSQQLKPGDQIHSQFAQGTATSTTQSTS